MLSRTRAAILSIAAAAIQPDVHAGEYLVYFGTFTGGSSQGIYVSRLDADSGRLSVPELAAEIPSPNFLAVSPDGRFVLAAARPNATDGAVVVFAVKRPSGMLEAIDEQQTGGAGPCHLSVDPTGRVVLVANYTSGSVKSFRLDSGGHLSDGTFVQHEGSSVNPDRQTGAHAHCIVPAPGGGFALACDLGTDHVMIYRLDPADASLVANDPAFADAPPGSGPRQLAFSPDGKVAYVVNEMGCTVSAYAWDAARGSLALRETVPLLPPGVEVAPTFSAAAIAVSPDGRFVYATVRKHDSISVLAVGADSGLSLVENVPSGGAVPRGMGIDPTGRWLLVGNQNSNAVAAFGVDTTTGRLTPTGQTVSVGSPVDVKFVRAELPSPQS